MTRYKVVVTPEAEAGIREAFTYIWERSTVQAERWLRQLYAKVDALEQFPERCAYARERVYLEEDLRQLVFMSHRAVFKVDKAIDTVYILHFRHAKQRAVGEPIDD